jgi:uncharacterized protein (DUF433 family)
MIDWTRCPEVESVPGRCGGQPVVKGTRVLVQGILDNAADCTPEQIATEIFDGITADQVRRILRFAYHAQLASLYEVRRNPEFPRDYELEGVILRHKLQALDNATPLIECRWKGCRATTEAPAAEGWHYRFPWLDEWPHQLEDGWYCPAHADIEAAHRRLRLRRPRRPR